MSKDEHIPAPRTNLNAASLHLVVLACAAGLGFTPLRLLPQNGLAEARWRRARDSSYRMTPTLSQGGS